MGRKSHSKQASKKTGKDNKLIQNIRRELSSRVDKLLKLTSVFQTTVNLTKSWEHHTEIEAVLSEIKNIESSVSSNKAPKSRQSRKENFFVWLTENGANYEGIDIKQFEGYDLGLVATNEFKQGSLLLTVPRKLMMTEQDARDSVLADFIAVDPLLQNMANITLALFLLLEKNNPESFWKPYIDVLPDKYSTVLYFTPEELLELKPSPVFESSLNLYRSIARQYAYFYNKIHILDLPVLKSLLEVFTFENYRWAVSTVMTRQNNLELASTNTTAFIPLWDMCNHDHGVITTDFNKELNRGECFALRDFQPNEQIFIFYGARSNADLFLHNGFVYPKNQHDSLSLALGVSSSDPLRESKRTLLAKLGLAGFTHYNIYLGDSPISAELLAFIRIFKMNDEELSKWSSHGLPGDLVSTEASSAEAVGSAIDRRAYTYLLTRCGLLRASYKKGDTTESQTLHSKNIKLLKECEVQILDGAIKYLEDAIQKLPAM
ncbi:SET domain containing 3 [Choristoneura fumiferana]|uniref:SET domain containing 3 n=1 Tax=Choristoneura fumiferana TaxID=7141 RepID=UPI003D15749C